MSIYVDPTQPGRDRPTLFADLLGQPSHQAHQQLENQASLILGWLCDRSPAIARALARLFLDDHPAVDSAARLGARTQVQLPSATKGNLRPDLSIEGSDRSFQLLVEVKTTASFAIHHHTGPPTLQHETYRHLWRDLTVGEARIRAVGTLTPKTTTQANALPDTVDLDRLQARDVAWSQVTDLLTRLDAHGALETDVRLVAMSFRDAIPLRLAPIPLDEQAVPDFLQRAAAPAQELAQAVADALGTHATGGGSAHDFVGYYVRYTDPSEQPVVLRIIATPAGGVLCPAGEGDSLIVAIGRDANALLSGDDRANATAAGIPTRRTAKFRLTCLRWDFAAGLQRTPVDLAGEVVAQLQRARLA